MSIKRRETTRLMKMITKCVVCKRNFIVVVEVLALELASETVVETDVNRPIESLHSQSVSLT